MSVAELGYLAPWGKKYSCAPSTKTMEFKVKSRFKKWKEQKQDIYCTIVIFRFEDNTIHYVLEKNWTKLK